MRHIAHVRLLTIQDGPYSNLVFENLDVAENDLLHYITVTKVPNWNTISPEIGDCGFLECEYVNAGDEYYERATGNTEKYKYDCCYFINFIKDKENVKTTDYKF